MNVNGNKIIITFASPKQKKKAKELLIILSIVL
jgi:hypothetical protein